MAKVGIIMGSSTDLPGMKGAVDVLKACGVKYEINVVSAHRTPAYMYEYAKDAKERGVQVIIAGAGGAAHLPGMVAAITTLPVIGVPIESKTLKGLDSLLSIAQMPKGIPVATVNINDAEGAGLFAAQIIGIKNKNIANKVDEYKKAKSNNN